MKRLWVFALLLLLALTSFEPALAQNQQSSQGGKLKAQGIYIGGSAGVGLTKLDLDEINLLDDSSLAWKAVAGYRWRNFAVEFDYRSLAKLEATIPGSELTAEAKGFSGSALLLLPLGPVDFFGRIGTFRATTKIGIGDAVNETKEWALIYGGGLGFRAGSFTIRAEYERPKLEPLIDGVASNVELHQFTGGFTIAF